MIQHIVAQTNLFWAQESADNPDTSGRPFDAVTYLEIYAWLGICVANGCHPVPNKKLIWSNEFAYGMPRLATVMSLTRFEQIKRYLQVNDNSKESASSDRLFKIRPLLSALSRNCTRVYNPHREVAVDEMDIPFKGRSPYKSRIIYKRAGDGFLLLSWFLSRVSYVLVAHWSFRFVRPFFCL